jgi:hypothetical protein
VKTCADCKHWEQRSWIASGYGSCAKLSDHYEGEGPAYAICSSSEANYDGGGIYTRADFGCVLFECKTCGPICQCDNDE